MTTLTVQSKDDEITEVTIQSTELQILREKAQIDIQVSTARAFPRNVKECLDEAIFTATMDYETAESCTYAMPRAGKIISGPGVRLAEIILQSWGNMRADTKVVEETAKHVISESFTWDLQKNNAVKVTVKRSIMSKNGRMTDDMITVTGNAANSIAFRNSVFKVIPRAITDKVYAAVQVKIIGGEGEFDKRLQDTLKAFKSKYDRTKEQVFSLINRTDIKDVTPGDLAVLIGIGTSLKSGELTIENLFKELAKSAEQKKEELRERQAEKSPESENTDGKLDLP